MNLTGMINYFSKDLSSVFHTKLIMFIICVVEYEKGSADQKRDNEILTLI